MHTYLLALLGVLIALPLHAQTLNLDFEQPSANGQPTGWTQFGGSGQSKLDSTVRYGGRYATRLSDVTGANFRAIDWSIPAKFGGKRLTLTGYVKTQDI